MTKGPSSGRPVGSGWADALGEFRAQVVGRRVVACVGLPRPVLVAEACGVLVLPVRILSEGAGDSKGLLGRGGLGEDWAGWVEALAEGWCRGVQELLVLTTTDSLRRLYANLRMLANHRAMPEIVALDLLEGVSESHLRYNEVQVEVLARRWNEGRLPEEASWRRAGEALRSWYAAWEQVRWLRWGGRLPAAEAARARRAAEELPPDVGASLLRAVAEAARSRALREGRRVFLAGSFADEAVYAALEEAGGIVAGEEWEPEESQAPGDVRGLEQAVAHLAANLPITRRSVADRLARLRNLVQKAAADAVVFVIRKGDYATRWALPVLSEGVREYVGRVLVVGEPEPVGMRAQLRKFLAGAGSDRRLLGPVSLKGHSEQVRSGGGHRALRAAREAMRYQRAWFQRLQTAAREGSPVALASADAPLELLRAAGIPFVVNQWWTALCAAKGCAEEYLRQLELRGYPGDLCRYCSVSLGTVLSGAEAGEPWGGLPRPRVVLARETCDGQRALAEAISRACGAVLCWISEVFPASAPVRWWEQLAEGWESWFGTDRLDVLQAELEWLCARLEQKGLGRVDGEELERVMDRVNQQCEWFRKCCDLLAETRPAPAVVSEWVAAVMIAQWHRGTQWALDLAAQLYGELAERASKGESAGPEDGVRLMWIGRGLWQDLRIYDELADRYGAVCVWSPHLALAAEGYPRYGGPAVRALGSRCGAIEHCLHTPPWNVAWYAKEAKRWGIQAAVHLRVKECSLASGGQFVRQALEAIGVPVLELEWDPVVGGGAQEEMLSLIGAFLEAL